MPACAQRPSSGNNGRRVSPIGLEAFNYASVSPNVVAEYNLTQGLLPVERRADDLEAECLVDSDHVLV